MPLAIVIYFFLVQMFRALLCPSSGARDYAAELPNWSFRSWFAVFEVRCGSAGGCRLKHSCALACSPDTTPAEPPHLTSNTQQTKNEATNVVIQQHSRELLMMGTVMSETCRAYMK